MAESAREQGLSDRSLCLRSIACKWPPGVYSESGLSHADDLNKGSPLEMCSFLVGLLSLDCLAGVHMLTSMDIVEKNALASQQVCAGRVSAHHNVMNLRGTV